MKRFAHRHWKLNPVCTKTKDCILFTMYHYCIGIHDEVSITYSSSEYSFKYREGKCSGLLYMSNCQMGKTFSVEDKAPTVSMVWRHAQIVHFTSSTVFTSNVCLRMHITRIISSELTHKGGNKLSRRHDKKYSHILLRDFH